MKWYSTYTSPNIYPFQPKIWFLGGYITGESLYLDPDALSKAGCRDDLSTDLYLVYPSRPPSSYDCNKNSLCSSKLTFKSISPTKGKWTWQSYSALCSQSWATRKPGRWTLMILSSTCHRLKRCDCYEFWEIDDFPFKFTHRIGLL